MKNMQENDLLSAMSDEVKGTVFRENRMRDHKLAYNEQLQILFFGYLQLKKCSAYMENA